MRRTLLWGLVFFLIGCNTLTETELSPTPLVPPEIVEVATTEPSLPTVEATPTITPSPVLAASVTPTPGSSSTPLIAAPTSTFVTEVAATTEPTVETPAATATIAIHGQVAVGRSGLRLRAQPNSSGTIIQNLQEKTQLTIIGRTADNQWVNVITEWGMAGWSMSQYIDLYIDLESLPVIDPSNPENMVNIPLPPDASGRVVGTGTGLRLRTLPSTNAEMKAMLADMTPLQVIGRTQDNRWLQVSTPNGVTGWVFAEYVELTLDINALPVPDEALAATPSSPQVAAGGGGSVNVPASGFISGVTSTSAVIFQRGQSMGNRANVFAKVGDSNTAGSYFLYPFGWSLHDLQSYSHLQPAINFFLGGTAIDSNSFSSMSYAAEGGWSTTSVLDPALARVPPCNAGETPLACEYRLAKPSISIIMLGTKEASFGVPLDQYEANLRTIVQFSIDSGVIPVLTTVPPGNHAWGEQVPAYNAVVVRVAQSFDVPVIDYYNAIVNLPQRGMSEDGIHPSVPPGGNDTVADLSAENLQFGFTVRNLITLQMLDAIWRNVIGG